MYEKCTEYETVLNEQLQGNVCLICQKTWHICSTNTKSKTMNNVQTALSEKLSLLGIPNRLSTPMVTQKHYRKHTRTDPRDSYSAWRLK